MVNQVKALASIFSVTACLFECASVALAKLRPLNCEDICSKLSV